MTIRILYVDDEPDIREVACMSLELDEAFEVRDCATGRDAISLAKTWQPHLVLLDVMMPQMDGPATLVELQAQADTAQIPVVFITARTQKTEVEWLKGLGAKGVIAKPFDPLTLAGQVRTYLSS